MVYTSWTLSKPPLGTTKKNSEFQVGIEPTTSVTPVECPNHLGPMLTITLVDSHLLLTLLAITMIAININDHD